MSPSEVPYRALSPMLTFDYRKLRPEEKERLWRDDSNYAAQVKLNGVRLIVHFVKDIGVFAHSRTLNLKGNMRTELTDRLLFGDFVPKFTAVVDAEAVVDKLVDTRPYTKGGRVTKSTLQSTVAALH